VLAVKPAGLYSSNEELRAVPIIHSCQRRTISPGEKRINLRVRSRVRHRQKVWPIVFEFEVLIGKFLAVDGFSPSALIFRVSLTGKEQEPGQTYVMASEIASL
jgi:hypothetical protein